MRRRLLLVLKLRIWRILDVVGPRWHRIDSGPAAGLVLAAPLSCRASYSRGRYEPHVVDVLDSIVRPGMVAFDIGSHLGYHTLTLALGVGTRGRVYAFEPVPRHARMLRRTLRANSLQQVSLIEMAVTDRTGRVTMEESLNPRVTRVVGDGLVGRLGRRFQAAAVSLDDWAEHSADVQRLDVVKLDVEGQEMAALRGCAGLLARHRPVVICEIHRFVGVPYTALELARWLAEAGYEAEWIAPRNLPAASLDQVLRQLDRTQVAPGEIAVAHVLARPRLPD